MLFTTKTLLTACKQAQKIMLKKSFQPILEAIYIDGFHVYATDTDSYLSLDCNSIDSTDIASHEVVITPAKRLVELLSKITTNEVVLNQQGLLDANGNRFEIINYDQQDWPTFPKPTGNPGIEVLSLGQALNTLVPFVADPKIHFGSVIGGININGNQLCATDGNRLSTIKLSTDTGLNAILPGIVVKQMASLFDKSHGLDIEAINGQIYIHDENWTLVTRLISGQYPQTGELFPADFKEDLPINRLEFITLLKLFKPSRKTKRPVVEFKDCMISSTSEADETVTTAKVNQYIPNFGVNPAYLTEALEAFKGNTVRMGFNGSLQPIVFSDETTHKHLLMPIETKEMRNEHLNKSQAVGLR